MKSESWDVVKLKRRTDYYRCYTYHGKRIYCGINSDTVCDEQSDQVQQIVDQKKPSAIRDWHTKRPAFQDWVNNECPGFDCDKEINLVASLLIQWVQETRP